MSYSRRLIVALSAMCLVVAFAAAPTAGAAGSASKAAAAKKSSAANKSANAPATLAQSRRTLARRINSVRRRTTRAERRLRTLGATVTQSVAELRGLITTGDTAIDGKINGIVGAVTPILTRLGEGLTQVGDGLLALKAGVETLAAKTTEGFATVEGALTDIGDFLGATEYGILQALVVQAGPVVQPQPGSFLVTPDIPDAVQQAQVSQQFVAQHAGNLGYLIGVRSGENDGTGATNPAANCRVNITNEAGTTEQYPANGAPPFTPIPTKSALTSTTPANQGFMFGPKTNNTNNDADVLITQVTTVPVAAGETYTVSLACVDLSPDANDPEA